MERCPTSCASGPRRARTKFDAGQGLDAASAGRLYATLGLIAMQSLNPSVDGWQQYLQLYGPLYVDIGYPIGSTTHAVIVTGISGDGSPDGTTITCIDPIPGAVVNRRFSDFLAQYEAPGAVDWPYVITHWPAAESAGHLRRDPVQSSRGRVPLADRFSTRRKARGLRCARPGRGRDGLADPR